jgi:glycosyltransferase involved in cell wall biosynthesis
MSLTRRITFVMPRTGEWASGGMRIIYEHASRLARCGHQVTVVHPGRFVIDPKGVDHVKNAVRFLLRRVDGRFTPERWLKVDPRVTMICVPSLAERFIPDGDIVIATAWQTAECVRQYGPKKGERFYFIQHLETWNGPQDRVFATWKAPLQKIVPSRWLVEVARQHGERAIYIPHGLDVEAFRIETPRDERVPGQLMMLYHNADWKGCPDGLKAVSIVREAIPDVRLILFGVPHRPDNLPEWMEYHQSPSPAHLRSLYNRASVFVAPSWTEGWGLTGCEALLCGAALAATDIDGHSEFAFHEKTALTSPPKEPEVLAANILRLLKDADLRNRLAEHGYNFVRQLTWERASTGLESALCGQA